MARSCPKVVSAWDMFNERGNAPRTVVTFCEKLDKALGGGIHLGHITELAGPASVGKTQICFQLTVDVQFPRELAGVAGNAVFIDTECSYKPKRVEEIANAAVRHVKEIADTPDLKAAALRFTTKSILNGTYVKRCLDLPSLVKTIQELEAFIQSHSKVKLIVVDSLAFHFRDDQWPVRDRRRMLLKSILTLAKVASNYNIAAVEDVHIRGSGMQGLPGLWLDIGLPGIGFIQHPTKVIAVNQITTRFTADGSGYEEPALSEVLTQNAGDQIVLGWRKTKDGSKDDPMDADRCALLYKSSHAQRAMVPFQLCADGIRDF